MEYLDRFRRRLEKKWKGSLLSVREARAIDKNAKKYLSKLAKAGEIERVTWGWYWIPDTYADFFDFLAKDKNFKVVQKQSAAAVWNGDFIHRDHFRVAVRDRGYGRVRIPMIVNGDSDDREQHRSEATLGSLNHH